MTIKFVNDSGQIASIINNNDIQLHTENNINIRLCQSFMKKKVLSKHRRLRYIIYVSIQTIKKRVLFSNTNNNIK